MNWRKPIIMLGILKTRNSPIPAELHFIRSIERKSREDILGLQNQRLTALLPHAWKHADYYRDGLSDCRVVRDGKIDLDRFEEISYLTKDILMLVGYYVLGGQLLGLLRWAK